MISKSEVAIVKGQDPEEMVKEAISLVGGMEGIVRKGDTVLIKPNICLPLPPEKGDSTDPQVVASLVKLAKAAGASRIIVGESGGWGLYVRDNFKISKIGEYAEEAGAELAYFDEEERVEIEIPGGVLLRKVSIPKVVKDADVIINVPKMKNNFVSIVTLGIKNFLAFLAPDDRYGIHRGVNGVELAYVVVDLLKVVKPKLTVVDGMIAMEGFGPHAGDLIRMDLLIAGKDVVAVDAVASEVMGYQAMEIPTTQIAFKQRLGIGDPSQIEVRGRKIDEVRRNFKRPMFTYISSHPNVTTYFGGVCCGCIYRIQETEDAIRIDPNKKYALVFGRRVNLPEKMDADEIWLVGDCTAPYKKKYKNSIFVAGCPPLKWYIHAVRLPRWSKEHGREFRTYDVDIRKQTNDIMKARSRLSKI
jgi:uncharacterized protein (DUF362 family)